MADTAVKAQIAAVASIGQGLATYQRSMSTALGSARSELNRTGAEFQVAIAGSQKRLRDAERQTQAARAALAACQEDCGGLQRDLARCIAAQQAAHDIHQRNLQAQSRFDRAASDLISSMATAQGALEALAPKARANVQQYAETLTSYLKRTS